MSCLVLLWCNLSIMIKWFLFIFFLLVIGISSFAQPVQQSKEHVYIDFNSSFSIVENSFTQTWDPLPGLQLNVRAPFYAGQLEAGLRYTRFMGSAPSETDSDFHSVFAHIGWNYPVKITSRFEIDPSIRFGNHFMLFDESAVFTNNSGSERFVTDQSESEFAYEISLRNQFSLTENWHLSASISYNRTLTFFPLPVTLFSLGVSRSFEQPRWLKKFIL